jgi:rod shape determining protein RodA
MRSSGTASDFSQYEPRQDLLEKLRLMPWGFVLLVFILSLAGVVLLYSAGGASWEPWAMTHMLRGIAGFALMIGIALTDIRFFYRWGWIGYGFLMLLLLAVFVMGHTGMGAKRWLNFGAFVLQPSEHMKIMLAIVLARYFHGLSYEKVGNPLRLLLPLGLVVVPCGLILIQPNLGTAALTLLLAASMFYLAGVRWWKFAAIAAALPFAGYYAWSHLHDYQKKRLTTFLDPEQDPLGSGYNIIQSKIALGSGGLYGKGFAMGTQSQLNFLPEKHTDFIFVVLAEEFGLIGAGIVLLLFFVLIAYGFIISLHAQNQFSRLLGLGLTTSIFLYMLTNIAMVAGLIPIVGIPLPLISYGGSVMLAFYITCGLLLSIAIHKNSRLDYNKPN